MLAFSLPAVLNNVLLSDAPIYDVKNAPLEMVHAWLQAAQNGNVNALVALFQLHNIIGLRVVFFWQETGTQTPTAETSPALAFFSSSNYGTSIFCYTHSPLACTPHHCFHSVLLQDQYQ